MDEPQAPVDALPSEGTAMWESGDPRKSYAALVLAGESLLEAVDLRFGQAVLDVGAGTGSSTLAAARRGARATALDPSPAALQIAQQRAHAEGLRIRRVLGLAEAMPFRPAAFDVTVSTFGVMFTNDPDQAAEELVRVTRPGGTLALASWTPEGFLGQVYRLTDPFGESAVLPTIWGSRDRIMAWFGKRADQVTTATRSVRLRGPTEERYVDYLCENFGPVIDALAEREEARRGELRGKLLELCHQFNRSGDPSALLPSEYLEVVVRLR